MPSTAITCSLIIDAVNEAEENDWEDTTREEREWMRTSRTLASELMTKIGYIKP